MKVFVELKPGARHTRVERIDRDHYKVSVKEPPVENRANNALIKALADHFDIPPSSLEVIAGRTSRKKIVEIS